jgi:hypothetical protein
MSIASTTRKAGPYTGNGVTSIFPFSFKVFSSSDLVVTQTDTSGVETTLTLTSNYTVSLNANQDSNPGGNVTCLVAPASSYLLTLTSAVPQLQPVVLTNNGGFYPSVINDALDRLTIFAQQILEKVNRTLSLPVSVSGVSTTLPVPVSNHVIAWNAAATGLQSLDTSSLASIVAFGTANADIFSGTGTKTSFTLSANPGAINNLDVSIAGITQKPSIDYTWTSGTTLIFTTAPAAGSNNILVRYLQALPQGSSDSASASFLQSGTGAVQRIAQDKMCETISVKDFGAVCDGITDDSAAVQAALTYAGTLFGGEVTALGNIYCASSITIPAGVCFRGGHQSIGSSRGNYSSEFTSAMSLRLSNTATITLSRGATLCNFLIINKNVLSALPFANVTAGLAAVAAFAGTAVYATNAEDIYIHNVRILGFAQAISTTLCDRIKIDWVDIDCTAGILLDFVYDISRIHNVHAWPFLTYGYTFSSASLFWYRSGSAFKVTGHFDGCTINTSFSYGYLVGFDIQALTGIDLVGCWVEGGGTSFISGQVGYKFSVAGDQTNMIGCGVDTCDVGVQANVSSLKLGLSGSCTFHACRVAFRAISAANISINDCHFYYPHSADTTSSPTVWPAPDALIRLDGMSGTASISNSFLYGSGLATGIAVTSFTNGLQITNNKLLACTTGILTDASTTGQALIKGNNFGGSTTPYNFSNQTFINKLTMGDSIGQASDTLGTVSANLNGQSAGSVFAFGGGNGPRFSNYYATGTAATPAIVAAANVLFAYYGYGYDGAAFQRAGLIRLQVDGTPAANSMPGALIASTTPTGSTSPIDRNATDNAGAFRPLTDNAYTCGASGFRWSAIWAATGTIQTSDKRTKTDIKNSELGLTFINALRPVSYRWIDGGTKIIRQEYLDVEGNIIPEGQPIPESAIPGEIITESQPGKRTNWGLIAQEVKQAVDEAGVDFGGWVLSDVDDAESQQALRYDQFISPLIKAVQELTARVVALETKV